MNHTFGRVLGFLYMILWTFFIIGITLMMPIDLYYESVGANYPTGLVWLYSQSWFHWRIAIVIISTIAVSGLGGFLIWVGWHQMHALDIKPINPLHVAEEHRKLTIKKPTKSN